MLREQMVSSPQNNVSGAVESPRVWGDKSFVS